MVSPVVILFIHSFPGAASLLPSFILSSHISSRERNFSSHGNTLFIIRVPMSSPSPSHSCPSTLLGEKPPKRKGKEYEEEKPPKRKGKECEEEKPPKPAQPESLASFMRSVLEDLKKNPERYNRRIQQPSLNDKAICEAALQKYNLDKGEEYEYWTVCSPYTSTVDRRYHFNFIGKHQTKSAEFFFADVGYVEPDNYDAVKCELVHENYYPGDEKVKWQFVIHPHAIPCSECNYE